MRANPGLVAAADAREAAWLAARLVAQAGRECADRGGCFTLAISGGSTPAPFFEALAALPEEEAPAWGETQLFWADERLCPPDDPASNFALARRHLLAGAPLPEANIHRVRTELGLAGAVEDVEARLADILGPHPGRGLDFVHLGLGPDGHVASLFPGGRALLARGRRVTAEPGPGLPPPLPRVTLTLEALARAGQVLFFIAGADKIALARRILAQATGTAAMPAALLLAERSQAGLPAPVWVAAP